MSARAFTLLRKAALSAAVRPHAGATRTPRALFATSITTASRSIARAAATRAAPISQLAVARMSSAVAEPQPEMLCHQCEQTEEGTGCTTIGVCGKTADVAALQDALVHLLKGVAQYTYAAREMGAHDDNLDVATLSMYFSTLTNVNFDADRFLEYIHDATTLRSRAREMYEGACKARGVTPQSMEGTPATWDAAGEFAQVVAAGKDVGLWKRRQDIDPDIFSLQEILMYGVKGMAAYAQHAAVLGKTSEDVFVFAERAMEYVTRKEQSVPDLLALAMECGQVNLKVMGMLNEGAIERYGVPEPTPVRVTPIAGKCILVSGHDYRDLEEILELTKDKGINVYTHGELLPAHGFPELKKYPHLAGNYGSAWQNQKIEFSEFPGPIVMTTNCIIEPRKSYQNRIYTCNEVGYPGVNHVKSRDFTPVVTQALSMPGFEEDEDEKTILTGFGHNAVLNVAGAVVNAVQEGKIKHFFLIGGCDGSEGERSYYKKLARAVPKDCVVLTLACGKYRFNKLDFGEIEGTGIPRLLDVGQCNDSFSAVQIASALAGAFKTDVNGLPLSIVLSWFEQKAVAVLLTLLSLDIKNIRIGPALPAFVTPNVLDVLVKNYQLTPIGTPKDDLDAMLNKGK